MPKEEEIRLSDREAAIVQRYADERGLTLDEAATQLFQAAMENKYRKNLNCGPAKVYSINRSKK